MNYSKSFQDAFALHQKGQLMEAKALYAQDLATRPDNADALHLLGLIEFSQKNPGKAQQLIIKAIALSPDNIIFRLNYGNILSDEGLIDAAIDQYNKAISLQPQNFESHFRFGLTLYKHGLYEQALKSLEIAAKINTKHFAVHNDLGNVLYKIKQYEKAIGSYRRALALNPKFADAHNNIGNAYLDLKNFEKAIASYQRAIALKPDFAEAYNNLGNAWRESKNLEKAADSYERALALAPTMAEASYGLGMIAVTEGDYLKAISLLGKSDALKPRQAGVHFHLGMAHSALKSTDAAIYNFERAIEIDPKHAEAHDQLGVVLQQLRQYDLARKNHELAIALDPRLASAHNNLGKIYFESKNFEAALQNFRNAVKLNSRISEFFKNLGSTLAELNQNDAASEAYEKAIKLSPYSINAYNDYGNFLQTQNRLNEAIAIYDKILSLNSDFHVAAFNKSLTHLLMGDYDVGWQLHECRFDVIDDKIRDELLNFKRCTQKESCIGKTLFISAEQGLGDAIQFCRYIPLLHKEGINVILEIDAALKNLFNQLSRHCTLFLKGDALPAIDYYCPLLSLPLIFQTSLNNVPTPSRYLVSDPELKLRWARRLTSNSQKSIGIVWSGNPRHKNDHRRSIPLLKLLQGLPNDVRLVVLQKQVSEADRQLLAADDRILNLSDEIQDFTDTAALCELMDVVVSVDTSVAHLSGALGVRTWVLLPFNPDWRWLLDRNDSPWYSSMRLYRQPNVDDWDRVLSGLSTDLQVLLQDPPLH